MQTRNVKVRLRDGEKMPEFLEVFNRLAMPILMETLGHPVGFYTSLVGPQNQFVHLWAYADLADYERRSRARADPAWSARGRERHSKEVAI